MAPTPIPDLPTLTGPTIQLRPWAIDDVDVIVEASTDAAITQITTVPSNATEADARAFIERQWTRPETDYGHARAIATLDTGEAIGHLYLSMIYHAAGRAEIGYWIAPNKRQRGAASEALDLASTWILTDLPLHRLTLYIEPWNDGSLATAARAGFEQEGLLRNWDTYDDGIPRDMHVLGRIGTVPD
jgi:ribosomal-protein-alanine N-acetyltransferase